MPTETVDRLADRLEGVPTRRDLDEAVAVLRGMGPQDGELEDEADRRWVTGSLVLLQERHSVCHWCKRSWGEHEREAEDSVVVRCPPHWERRPRLTSSPSEPDNGADVEGLEALADWMGRRAAGNTSAEARAAFKMCRDRLRSTLRIESREGADGEPAEPGFDAEAAVDVLHAVDEGLLERLRALEDRVERVEAVAHEPVAIPIGNLVARLEALELAAEDGRAEP